MTAQHSDMIFTLHEDTPNATEDKKKPNTVQNLHIKGGANWEQSLGNLQKYKQPRNDADNAALQQLIQAAPQNRATTPSEENTLKPQTAEPAIFGDDELDYAYRAFLLQREQQHNQDNSNIAPESDVGVLIQEDWLAAQTALQSEHNRRHLTAKQTLVFHPETQTLQAPEPTESQDETVKSTPDLPPYTVHVYDLPNIPATRRIKILSERELMNAIADRLKPHLSSVISGMVRQALQKKLANLSYDLQTELSTETPQVVQEILDHHLSTIMQLCKERL